MIGVRRAVRRVCAAGAVACLAIAVIPGPARAQSTGDDEIVRPEVFNGSAAALAASVQLDRAGLLPVPDLFRFIVADGSGTYQPSEQRGRASLFFPGNGGIVGPSLACSQFPPEAEPVFGPIVDACLTYSFPLSVTADSLEPDAGTEGSVGLGTPADPISAQGVGAHAHAGIDRVNTDAAIGDFRLLGAPALGPLPAVPGLEDLEPFLVAIGSATATTDQRITEEGDLLVESISAVSDVDLVGGLVHIGSVVSTARIVDAPGEAEGDPTIVATLEVSGATVGGMPAAVSGDGLQLGTASQPLGPLLEASIAQLEGLLESISFSVVPTEVTQGVDEDGIAFAGVGGLLISMSVPVEGVPSVPGPLGDIDLNGEYVGSVLLGAAGARGLAASFSSDVVPPAGGSAGGPVGGSFGSPVGSGSGVPAPGRPVAAPPLAPGGAATPGATGDASTSAIGFLDDFGDRLALLYLAFTLSAVAACLAPRLTLPARLPGSRA